MTIRRCFVTVLYLIIIQTTTLLAQTLRSTFREANFEYQITKLFPRQVSLSKADKNITGKVFIAPTVSYRGIDYRITSIGEAAFNECRGLISITLPNTVTTIGQEAFYNCKRLTEINLPNSLTIIGDLALGGCDSLSQITSSITDFSVLKMRGDVFYNVPNTCILYVPKEKIADYQREKHWNHFVKIRPIGALYGIGDRFKKGQLYYQITSVSPHRVSVIPQRLASPYWDNREKPIGKITVPDIITYFGSTFSVTDIGKSAFNGCLELTEVKLPNSINRIGKSAFSDCIALEYIDIPISVRVIEDWAFNECVALNRIKLPNTILKIGIRSFGNCRNLSQVIIPSSVIEIGDYAFGFCMNLSSITLPASIQSIGEGAFNGCSALSNLESKITDPSKVVLGDGVFTFVNQNDCVLYVPKGNLNKYKVTGQWKEFVIMKEL